MIELHLSLYLGTHLSTYFTQVVKWCFWNFIVLTSTMCCVTKHRVSLMNSTYFILPCNHNFPPSFTHCISYLNNVGTNWVCRINSPLHLKLNVKVVLKTHFLSRLENLFSILLHPSVQSCMSYKILVLKINYIHNNHMKSSSTLSIIVPYKPILFNF